MGTPFQIRPASTADARALAALERDVFSDPWPVGDFAVPGPGVAILVAADADAILGFIVVRVVADEAEILDIAVREGHRRRGIGTALLAQALTVLGAAGAVRLHLEVRGSNREAREFYERHGFAVTGIRARYYRKPPEDAVTMAREVTLVTGGA